MPYQSSIRFGCARWMDTRASGIFTSFSFYFCIAHFLFSFPPIFLTSQATNFRSRFSKNIPKVNSRYLFSVPDCVPRKLNYKVSFAVRMDEKRKHVYFSIKRKCRENSTTLRNREKIDFSSSVFLRRQATERKTRKLVIF